MQIEGWHKSGDKGAWSENVPWGTTCYKGEPGLDDQFVLVMKSKQTMKLMALFLDRDDIEKLVRDFQQFLDFRKFLAE